jgi:hypothetical protein
MHACAESDLQLPCQHQITGWINNYGSHKCLLGGLRGEKKISTVARKELIFERKCRCSYGAEKVVVVYPTLTSWHVAYTYRAQP